jgi:hypothetical protein
MENLTYSQDLECEIFLRRRIIDLCAPVLAGIKPAALISFHQDHCNLNLLWNKNRSNYENHLLLPQLKFYELRKNSHETLVLLYRSLQLEKVLANQANQRFLNSLGYYSNSLPETLDRIHARFQVGCPHEVGIILGIPLWDVAGFIANRGRNYLFNGYWKVYHHPEEALRTFLLYDQARREVKKDDSMRTLYNSST